MTILGWLTILLVLAAVERGFDAVSGVDPKREPLASNMARDRLAAGTGTPVPSELKGNAAAAAETPAG